MLGITAEALTVLMVVSVVAAHLAAAVLVAVAALDAAVVRVDGQDNPLTSVLVL